MAVSFKKLITANLLLFLLLANHSCRNTITRAEKDFDIVILNGRVIGPESGLDEVMNIGIRNGAIEAITDREVKGLTSIDAEGLVVAPGFIDIHQHGQDQVTYEDPARFSKGILYVIVNGILAVNNGHLYDNIFPGKAVRGVVR